MTQFLFIIVIITIKLIESMIYKILGNPTN